MWSTDGEAVEKFRLVMSQRRFKILIGKLSDKFFPTQTLLYVSVRHIFISLTSFIGVANSVRMLYKSSLLTES